MDGRDMPFCCMLFHICIMTDEERKFGIYHLMDLRPLWPVVVQERQGCR